ncbi:hypothetical protein IRJ41_009306 [Triplophysa rosa]|uniref:Phosphatidylinositol-specific phospholipase C X domain-containing protein n=1 Tax=Triplophysa rosa TaxID=992332 RepID=A0A9W8C3P7_TRIRA|nr:hypothetical protein IRJ41_009306 [Triplophysa rosa]
MIIVIKILLHRSACQIEGYNDDERLDLPKSYNIGWMATLDNNKSIYEITIPGTHDTLALRGSRYAECQAWSLMDQLKAGIRYLDLRVSGENLEIKHGIMYQNITFPEVLNTTKSFLSEFKTETVFVRVKPVFWFKGRVADSIVNMIENDPNSIFRFDSDEATKIGNVRGKIVYFQKNSFYLGIFLNGTDKKGDHKVSNVERKKNLILTHLNNTRNNCGKDSVILNYSSGTGAFFGLHLFRGLPLTPKDVAREINPWLLNYLNTESSKPCFGIIAMDFPSFDLIQAVINLN